jgi:hypothetical protein
MQLKLGHFPGPMSNAERQRLFRRRNPGYYASLQRTRRASAKRGAKQLREAMRLALQAKLADAPLPQQDASESPDLQPAPTAC